jgi:hypothetical protein
MAPAFGNNDPETRKRPDWELLQNGFVTLFCRAHVFTEAKTALAALGYLVVELNAGEWRTREDALVAIGTALHFPDYYGRNLDALVDCLRDVASYGLPEP